MKALGATVTRQKALFADRNATFHDLTVKINTKRLDARHSRIIASLFGIRYCCQMSPSYLLTLHQVASSFSRQILMAHQAAKQL
jgi:hypothetical protein